MKILDSQGISWHTMSIPTACSRVAWHHRTRQPMDGQKRRGARAEGEHLSYFQDLSGPFDLAANLAPAFFFENWGWVKTKKATHFPTAPRGMTIPGCTSSSRFRGGSDGFPHRFWDVKMWIYRWEPPFSSIWWLRERFGLYMYSLKMRSNGTAN